MTSEPERRTVLIDRSPPRRMLASLRYRSMKTNPDRTIWDSCWYLVRRLTAEGWRLCSVTVDWGPSVPMTDAWRRQTLRELTGCYDGCDVRETTGDPGRGTTTVELMRE